jgi:hypothetical protein
MQTIGATLLGIKRCSLGRVWLAAHDGPSVHGLLYLAAVQLRTCQRCAPSAGRPGAVALPMPPVPQVISTVRPAIGSLWTCSMLVWFGARSPCSRCLDAQPWPGCRRRSWLCGGRDRFLPQKVLAAVAGMSAVLASV